MRSIFLAIIVSLLFTSGCSRQAQEQSQEVAEAVPAQATDSPSSQTTPPPGTETEGAPASESSTQPAAAAEGPAASAAEDLAKKLSNPVASLISVPIQLNYDHRLGFEDDGERFLLNVQPVIPISLNEDWNLISRTVVPVIDQNDAFPPLLGLGDQFGLGDIVQSLFFSPAEPGPSGIIWGVGPAILLPTATDELLGGEKWGAGPTAVVLKQFGPWTVGSLANHISSFAGEDSRGDIESTYLQPFLSYTAPGAWTFGLNAESTYDWEGEQWAVPVNFTISKLLKLGPQPVSLTGGVRYWADGSDEGPEGWGFRAGITFLFPK